MENASMASTGMAHNAGHNPHSMADDPKRHQDHEAFAKLMAAATPTHTAIKSGAWSDPQTWQNGRVPDANATALIKQGTTVTYDQVSDARLRTIINQGNLKFAANKDTQLLVETILNGPEGKLDIGAENQAVAADKKARIIFTSDRTINTQWDPTQLSKGLVSHGEVNIYGADKLDKVALAGDATASSSVLTFKQAPTGWQIGDKIVLGGTGYGWNGTDADNSRLQDEVLTVTAINGNQVSFVNDDIESGDRNVLRFDHTRSDITATNQLSLYAANLTRNVSFETENGKNVPIDRRAHVMLMHSPKVNVLNAGFYDLGRSDKSKVVDDIGKNVDGSNGNGSNIRGRYSLHLHRTGADSLDGQAALLRGNAVVGSPGWGIVQHDSHAGLEDNIVFDVVGSGIVAESGNEIGWWTDNMVIKTTGAQGKGDSQRETRDNRFDFGFEGDGYWIQGAAQVKNKDNKAVSSNRTGMTLFGSVLAPKGRFRDQETILVKNLPAELQKLFPKDQTEVDVRDVPMARISGFESYNAHTGFQVWGHQTNFDGEGDFSSQDVKTAHQGRSLIDNFKLWGNRWTGAVVQYSTHIDLKDGLILGRGADKISGGQGLSNNHASFGTTYDNLTIAGFSEGVQFEYPNNDKDFISPELKNSKLFNNTYHLAKVGHRGPIDGRPSDFGSFVKLSNNQFAEQQNNRAPVAKFSNKGIGGLAVQLDGSASSDLDPLRSADGSPRSLASKGIAAYGWDLNNDGKIDRFGRTISHVFDQAGSRDVSLTVLDSQGKASTLTQKIDVKPTAYANALKDGAFNSGTKLSEGWKSGSGSSDQGWYADKGVSLADGAAKLSAAGDWGNFLGQVIRDQQVRRGQQKLSFKLKNLEGSTGKPWERNEIKVTLWGVNGQFNNNPWEGTGPTQPGTLPMQRTQLVSKAFGGEAGEFFDWKNFNMDVNLGKGYDYLLFQVSTTRTNNPQDYVAIDNISLTGAADTLSKPSGETAVLSSNITRPSSSQPLVSADVQSFTNEVLRLTNEFRAENGLAPLKANAELAQAAQDYSETMAIGDFFSHTGKDGSNLGDRAERAGYEALRLGENIAAGQRSPESVVNGWINSPGHRANLLNPNYTELGAGYFKLDNDTGSVNYNTYWTQLFGSGDLKPDTAPAPAPTKQPIAKLMTPPTVNLDPVAKLSFDEGTGKLAVDTAPGVKNNGRLRGDARWTPGKAGQAVAFDGTGDVVTLNDAKEINLGTHAQRSVSLWFRVDEAAAGRQQVIYEEGGTTRGLNAYVQDDLLYVGGWNTPESKWSGSWLKTGNVSSGQWHHAALVLDGKETVQAGALTAYLDGQKIGQMDGSQLWAHGDGIGIGNVNGNTRFEDGNSSGSAYGLAGAVDEVQIFNSALNSTQVKQLATAFG
ncbi:CAP domain-containing protein [Leptolyngbya sp. BC1307]|uniref:CAP domain-containing protein n=1 Tax=Leptolyngbya sp. BC1307 TaxID=2029589 RepID=UPI000EFBBC1E|nr:CAP domain-containing protein [Leptolyngbya sp. BC1307]